MEKNETRLWGYTEKLFRINSKQRIWVIQKRKVVPWSSWRNQKIGWKSENLWGRWGKVSWTVKIIQVESLWRWIKNGRSGWTNEGQFRENVRKQQSQDSKADRWNHKLKSKVIKRSWVNIGSEGRKRKLYDENALIW